MAIDYSFNNRGIDVSVAPKNGGGYTLTATSSGNINFYQNQSQVSTMGTGTGYKLTANFDASSNFVATGSTLTITGSLDNPLGGTGDYTDTTLYSAKLTDFGTDKSSAEIAFKTDFTGSTAWSNQVKFTGGSKGEVVYLFDQVGLNNGGHGRLSSLINALDSNNLSKVNNLHFTGIESIASVPLPLPIILFGTGLTALIGLGRKRLNTTKSI